MWRSLMAVVLRFCFYFLLIFTFVINCCHGRRWCTCGTGFRWSQTVHTCWRACWRPSMRRSPSWAARRTRNDRTTMTTSVWRSCCAASVSDTRAASTRPNTASGSSSHSQFREYSLMVQMPPAPSQSTIASCRQRHLVHSYFFHNVSTYDRWGGPHYYFFRQNLAVVYCCCILGIM